LINEPKKIGDIYSPAGRVILSRSEGSRIRSGILYGLARTRLEWRAPHSLGHEILSVSEG